MTVGHVRCLELCIGVLKLYGQKKLICLCESECGGSDLSLRAAKYCQILRSDNCLWLSTASHSRKGLIIRILVKLLSKLRSFGVCE